ncbi:MAG: YbaK/EbsC family protein [Pseudomonadota bacterium]
MAKSVTRVREAAATAGVAITVLTMPVSTRTAAEAAAACGCAEAAIIKSLIFAAGEDLVLLLVPGDRQVDPALGASAVGAPLTRADPKRVRAVTGFAIGGVSPIGHLTPVATFLDTAVGDGPLFAAAGAPNSVFETTRGDLLALGHFAPHTAREKCPIL